jgi:allantoinase
VHIVHFSLAEGYELVEAYRDMGTRATAEICFHYLKFTNEDMVKEGARLKVGPPIRPAPENEMLWEQVLDGKAAFVTSDHVGWTIERKSGSDIFACGAGVPGVETLMPGFFTMAVDERGMDLTEAVRLLSLSPARFFGLYPRKGAIEVGADADFAIVERTDWTFDESGLHDEGRWSPFHGMKLRWKPAATYLRGELIFDGKDVIGKPGAGGYLARVTPAEPDFEFLQVAD